MRVLWENPGLFWNHFKRHGDKYEMRECCGSKSVFKVTYDGGSLENDIILVCDLHISKHPYNKRIIKTELIEWWMIKDTILIYIVLLAVKTW